MRLRVSPPTSVFRARTKPQKDETPMPFALEPEIREDHGLPSMRRSSGSLGNIGGKPPSGGEQAKGGSGKYGNDSFQKSPKAGGHEDDAAANTLKVNLASQPLTCVLRASLTIIILSCFLNWYVEHGRIGSYFRKISFHAMRWASVEIGGYGSTGI